MSPLYRIVAGLVAALAAGAVVLSYVGTLQQRELVGCYTSLNSDFREAIRERDAAGTVERQAQRDLLNQAALPGPTDPAAIGTYLAALQESDARRAASPLPENYCD